MAPELRRKRHGVRRSRVCIFPCFDCRWSTPTTHPNPPFLDTSQKTLGYPRCRYSTNYLHLYENVNPNRLNVILSERDSCGRRESPTNESLPFFRCTTGRRKRFHDNLVPPRPPLPLPDCRFSRRRPWSITYFFLPAPSAPRRRSVPLSPTSYSVPFLFVSNKKWIPPLPSEMSVASKIRWEFFTNTKK